LRLPAALLDARLAVPAAGLAQARALQEALAAGLVRGRGVGGEGLITRAAPEQEEAGQDRDREKGGHTHGLVSPRGRSAANRARRRRSNRRPEGGAASHREPDDSLKPTSGQRANRRAGAAPEPCAGPPGRYGPGNAQGEHSPTRRRRQLAMSKTSLGAMAARSRCVYSAGDRADRGRAMMDQARVARIARHIFEGHERRRRFERLRGELAPASLEEAYAVQDEVHRLFRAAGWGELAGHKIALTSKPVQELCGVDQPAGGAIFARTVHRSPATVRLGDFMHLGLEFELGLRLGADLPPSG